MSKRKGVKSGDIFVPSKREDDAKNKKKGWNGEVMVWFFILKKNLKNRYLERVYLLKDACQQVPGPTRGYKETKL
jgi:hypothetical protein